MIDTKKECWAYMLEKGHLTNGKWSYYGGDWEYPNGGWDKEEKDRKKLLSKVKTVGVDWEKTEEPVSSLESSFTDTFHDPESVETLLGFIVLKDGTQHLIGVGNASMTFVAYAKMVKDRERSEKRVKDIFGE